MSSECTHPGCGYPIIRRGYCNMHLLRLDRGKDMDAPRRASKHTPDAERFWSKVNKSGACWEWNGSKLRGYGQFRYKGATRYAHRVVYEWTYGAIPDGLHIDHTCWNRGCMNPAHMKAVTQAENNQNYPGARVDSKTGIRGVCWDGEKQKYLARATLGGVTQHLGYFDDIREAEAAVVAWRRRHMPNSLADQRPVTGSFFMPEHGDVA